MFFLSPKPNGIAIKKIYPKVFFSETKYTNFNFPQLTMPKVRFVFLLSAVFCLLVSCNPVYQAATVKYNGYKIMNMRTDSSVQNFLKPYSDSMNSSMNVVLATLETDLEKRQPECTLGNFMADAIFAMAEKKYGEKPDAAFMNFGGIRLPSVSAGLITRGKIYELFPFDNILLLVKIKGDVLQQFLNHISARGGWPVAGMTMQIKNKKAVNVIIGGVPVDMNKEYKIAIGDYTANGGDDAAMLKGLPQINNGYLMRDALIDYATALKKINVQLEKRVSNAE
ncbi:MAG: 5'-nucleotidase C-terminal domain-containing protein [Chitinophagaceae bacterium]|nr:5'-nucleotidase C-terminal domain-containing protein [Chitinophagaceae bacterium]